MDAQQLQALIIDIGAPWIIEQQPRWAAYHTAIKAMLDAGLEPTPAGDDDWDAVLEEIGQ